MNNQNHPAGLKDRLKYWSQKNYGSIREIARRTGLNYTNLTQLSDDTPPSSYILKPLVELGLNVHWLLTGEGRMNARKITQRKGKAFTPTTKTGFTLTCQSCGSVQHLGNHGSLVRDLDVSKGYKIEITCETCHQKIEF